jgi:hypothetical protein
MLMSMAWPSPLSLIDQLENDLLPDFRDEDGFGLSYRYEWEAQEDGEEPKLVVTITEEIPYVFRGTLNPLRAMGMTTIVPLEMECAELRPSYNWRRFLRGRKAKAELNVTARLVAAKAAQAVRIKQRAAELRRERRDRWLAERGKNIRVAGGL